MVDFGAGAYYTPMDQQYHSNSQTNDRRTDVEDKPIFPIHMIGQTVPDIDPATRRNVVGQVEAAFRGGAGNIQLVMQVAGQAQPIGGGPKAYGEEIRQEIREIQKASGGKITGIELPTSINNLSGFDGRQGFSEEQRELALAEVRDSIKFVGDIAGGGGVDIVSFEFPRNFSDSKWLKEEQQKGFKFKQRGEEHPAIVDTQTGAMQQFHPNQKFYMNKKPGTDEETPGKPQVWTWNDFKALGEKQGKRAETVFVNEYLKKQEERQIKNQESTLQYYEDQYTDQINSLNEQMKDPRMPEEIKNQAKDRITKIEGRLKQEKEQMAQLEIEKERIADYSTRYQTVDEVGFNKAKQSYAQAGIWAYQESQKNKYVQQGKGAIYVGPEMGWPTYFGSHPKEWVDLILKSRNELVEQLTKKEINGQKNLNYTGVSEREAQQIAKTHIKGELDTGHLGMWLQSFREDLPWDQRVTEFKKWYKGQIEFLAGENKKHDIIGGIQAVDSASGAHGHLPPGQGVLGKDIFEYMKILKEKGGYKGEITSEGHEEENFGHGRILTKAWEAFGSQVSSGYWDSRFRPTFNDIKNSYAQIAYGTTGIFQSYVPSNDFTLWSNVPLE